MSLRSRLCAPLISAVAASMIGALLSSAPAIAAESGKPDRPSVLAREKAAAADGLSRSEATFARSAYLCMGYRACGAAGMTAAGYSSVNDRMYWRMYAGHNCTNYVAYRMVHSGLPNTRPWSGGGNATYWGTSNPNITDQVPAVGAVAWWRANTGPAGSAGHVAYVERVVSADQIIVSQDSWGGDFSWAVITRASGNWPSGFVHFNDQRLVNTAAPVIAGMAKVGARLTSTAGTWSQPSPTVTYQWYANGVAIPAATASTLTINSARLGQTLQVRTTARKLGFRTTRVTSAPTSPVLPGALAATAAPVLSGEVKVDKTLTVNLGTWNVPPSAQTVQWYADGQPIPNAVGSTLALSPDLAGRSISAQVTATRAGYTPVTVYTAATPPVALGTFTVGRAPAVSGTPKPGQTLAVDTGAYRPGAGAVTVEWLRQGRPVPEATGATYRLTPADLGSLVSARVTISRDGYQTTTLTSPATVHVRVTPRFKVDRVRIRNGMRYRFTMSAPYNTPVDGTIAVRLQGGFTQKVVLQRGIARLTITGVSPGRHAMRVVYRGSSKVESRVRTGSVSIR